MWFTILLFLNFIGIFTNAFIIGFTSRFGRKYQTTVVQYNITGMVQNCSLISEKSNEGFVNIRLNAYQNLWIIIIFEVRGFFSRCRKSFSKMLEKWTRNLVKGGSKKERHEEDRETIFTKVASWWQKTPLKTDSSIHYVWSVSGCYPDVSTVTTTKN